MCKKVWNMIALKLNSGLIMEGFGCFSVVYILFGLFFLQMYPTSHQATTTLGRSVGCNQFQKYTQFMIQKIAGLEDQVVSKRIKSIDNLAIVYFFID